MASLDLRWWRAQGVFGILNLVLLASPRALAETKSNSATAQALFEQARALMAEGRAAEACPKLEESQRLDPGSGTQLNLARCYEQAGRLASAWNQYLEAASAARSAGNAEREGEARRRADALRPRLPSLVIALSDEARQTPGLEVRRDGELVGAPQLGLPLPADAGEHTLEASAPGRVTWKTVIVLKGESHVITVSVPGLVAAPAIGPTTTAATSGNAGVAAATKEAGLGTQRIVALVAGGVGVVSLGVGIGFGFKSKSKHDEAEKYCDGSACRSPEGVTAGNDAYAAGNVATAFSVIGLVGIAAGATLWFTAPRTDAAGFEVSVGPASARIRGVF